MCTGAAFRPKFEWGSLPTLAKADFKPDVPKAPGVYCLWVQEAGNTDISRIIEGYKATEFMEAIKALDKVSRQFFREASLAENYGWATFNSMIGIDAAIKRVSRLRQIQIAGAKVVCPILYLGSANNLRRRLDELAFGGHTANHAVWPLLLFGWRLEVGWSETTDYKDEENSLKDLYKDRHSSSLPPLVDR